MAQGLTLRAQSEQRFSVGKYCRRTFAFARVSIVTTDQSIHRPYGRATLHLLGFAIIGRIGILGYWAPYKHSILLSRIEVISRNLGLRLIHSDCISLRTQLPLPFFNSHVGRIPFADLILRHYGGYRIVVEWRWIRGSSCDVRAFVTVKWFDRRNCWTRVL